MRFAKTLTVLLFLSTIVGCASASVPRAMVPTTAPTIAQRHMSSVAVQVSGGQATSAAGISQIADEDFRTAIVQAIDQSKVFAKLTDGKSADYQLYVHIMSLDQPLFGASFTVKMETAWRLVPTGAEAPILEAVVESSGTATMGDAFAGPKRLRLANEAAARENIRIGIERLSRADAK